MHGQQNVTKEKFQGCFDPEMILFLSLSFPSIFASLLCFIIFVNFFCLFTETVAYFNTVPVSQYSN